MRERRAVSHYTDNIVSDGQNAGKQMNGVENGKYEFGNSQTRYMFIVQQSRSDPWPSDYTRFLSNETLFFVCSHFDYFSILHGQHRLCRHPIFDFQCGPPVSTLIDS